MSQTQDTLKGHAPRSDQTPGGVPIEAKSSAVQIPFDHSSLPGQLEIPPRARALILFAHGSGSSRLSPRNQEVARYFRDHKLGTLLFDLLTPDEEAEDRLTHALRFDIGLLSDRLVAATRWVLEDPDTQSLPCGYFGASTGAAAALVAASRLEDRVFAVVSRGGRPDLADQALGRVTAPTLLIVGGHDETVLDLNRDAMAQMTKTTPTLRIVPGATHLFEEPGCLEQVANLATDWFGRHSPL